MRSLIVKHFALLFRVRMFGVTSVNPRCIRIVFPYFLLIMIVHLQNPVHFGVLDFLLVAGFFLLMWLSIPFPFPGISYFDLYPVKWEELDDEQKYDFGRNPLNSLTDDQSKEWELISAKFNTLK